MNTTLCLPSTYHRRLNPEPFFDNDGEHALYQTDVYRLARSLWEGGPVIDVGCGLAHKLLWHFSSARIVGVEANPATRHALRQRYFHAGLEFAPTPRILADSIGEIPPRWRRAEMVICADVIEHITDPASLLRDIATLDFEVGILSTPDRDSLPARAHTGPPINTSHAQEWATDEFQSFVSEHFQIMETHQTREPGYFSQTLVFRKAT